MRPRWLTRGCAGELTSTRFGRRRRARHGLQAGRSRWAAGLLACLFLPAACCCPVCPGFACSLAARCHSPSCHSPHARGPLQGGLVHPGSFPGPGHRQAQLWVRRHRQEEPQPLVRQLRRGGGRRRWQRWGRLNSHRHCAFQEGLAPACCRFQRSCRRSSAAGCCQVLTRRGVPPLVAAGVWPGRHHRLPAGLRGGQHRVHQERQAAGTGLPAAAGGGA